MIRQPEVKETNVEPIFRVDTPLTESFSLDKNEIIDMKTLIPEPIIEDDNISINSDMSRIKEIHINSSQDKKNKRPSFF